MPSNATRRRIEWCPSDAAFQALQNAEHLFGELGRQAVIDKLVLTGLSALTFQHWVPPQLYGRNRDKWRLPQAARYSFPDNAPKCSQAESRPFPEGTDSLSSSDALTK